MDTPWQWLIASPGVAAASPNPAADDHNDYHDDNDMMLGRGGVGESMDSIDEFLENEDELRPPPARPGLDPPEDEDYFTDGGYQTDDFLPTLLENRVLDCMANTGAPFSNMLDYIDSPPGLGATTPAEAELNNIGMFDEIDDNSVVEEEFSDKEERIQRIRSYMKRLEKRETIKTPNPITLIAQPIPLHDDVGHEIPLYQEPVESDFSNQSEQSDQGQSVEEANDCSDSNQSEQSDQLGSHNQLVLVDDYSSDSNQLEQSDPEGSHQPVSANGYCSDSNQSEQSNQSSQNQPVVADDYCSDSNQSEQSDQWPPRHNHSVVVVNGCSDSYQSEHSDEGPSLHKKPSGANACSESTQTEQNDAFLDPRTPITHATSGSETDSPSVPKPPSRVVNQTPSIHLLFRLADISFRIPNILPISRNSKPPVVNKTMSDFYARNRSRLISGRSEQSQQSSPDISIESLQTEQPIGDDERVEVVFTDKELPKDDQFQFGVPEGMVFVPQSAPSPVEESSRALNSQMRRSSIMEYNTTSDESSANMQDSVPDETAKHRNNQQLDHAQTQSKSSGSSRPDLLVLEPTSVQAGHETHPIDLVEIEAEEVVMPSCLPPARSPARSPLRSPLRKRPRHRIRRRATRQQEFSPKIEMSAPLDYDSPNSKKKHDLHNPTSPQTEIRYTSTSNEPKDVIKIESSCSEDSFSTEMDNTSSNREIARAKADFRVTELVAVEWEDERRYCPERFTFAEEIEPTCGDVIEILSSDCGGNSSSPSLLRRSDMPGAGTKTADLIQAQKHNMTSCCNPASSTRRAVQKRVRRPTFAERIEPTMEDLCCIKSEQQLGPSIHATSPTRQSKVARPTFAERIEPTLEDIPCCPFSPNDEHKVINVEVLDWEQSPKHRNDHVTGKPRPTLAERIEPTLEDIPCCQFCPADDQPATSAYHVQASMLERPRGVSTKARVATGRGPTKGGPSTVMHGELDPDQSSETHHSPRGQRKFDPPSFSDVERRQSNIKMDVRPRQKNVESNNTKRENEPTNESSFLLHHRIDKAVIRLCDQSEYVHNEESMLKPTSDAEVRRRLWKPPPDCMAPQRTNYPLEPLANNAPARSDKPVIDLSTHNLDPPGSHPDPPALTQDWTRPSPERDTKSNNPAVGENFASNSTGAKSIGNVTFGRTKYNDNMSNRRTGVQQDQRHRLASVKRTVATPLKRRESSQFGSAIRGLDMIAQRLESDLGISSLSGVGRAFSNRSRPSPYKTRISGVPASSASVRDRMANLRAGRVMYASDRYIGPGSRPRDWRSTVHATRPTERAGYSRSGNRANVETVLEDLPSRSQSKGRRQDERERTVGRAKANSTSTRLRPLEMDAHHNVVSSSSEATTDSFDGHVSTLLDAFGQKLNRMKENTRSARSTKGGAAFGDSAASSFIGTSRLSQLRESVNADRKKLLSRFSYLLTDTKEAGARPDNESSMETSILRHTQAAISQSGVLMFRPNINVYHGRASVNPQYGDEGSPLSIENNHNENRQDRDCSEERTEEREDAPRNNIDEDKGYPDGETMRDGGARDLFTGPPTINRFKSNNLQAVQNEPEIIQVEDTLNEHEVIHLEGLDEDFHWRFSNGWKQSAFRHDQMDRSSPQEDIDKKLDGGILKTHFEAADAKLAAALIGEEQFKKFEPAVCTHDDDDGMDEEMKNLQVSEELLRQELELVQNRVARRRRQLLPCWNGVDGNTEKVATYESRRQNHGVWDARETEQNLENQRGKVSLLAGGGCGPSQSANRFFDEVTNDRRMASYFGADKNPKEPSKIKNEASQQATRMEPQITFVEEPGSAELYLKATGDNSTKALQLSGADLATESAHRLEALTVEEIAGTDPPGISCKQNCPSDEGVQLKGNFEYPRSRLPVTAHFQRQAEAEPSGDKIKRSEANSKHLNLSQSPLMTSCAYGDLFERYSSPPRPSEMEDSKVQVMHHQYEEVVEVCVDDSDSTEYSEVENIEVVFVEQSFASTDVFTYGEKGGIVFDWVRDESAFDEQDTKNVPQTINHKKERRVEIISVVSMEEKCSGTGIRGPKATLSLGRVEVAGRPRIIPSSHQKSSCIQNAVDLTLPSLNHDAETVARERSYPGNDSAMYNHSRDDTTPGSALVQDLKQVEGYFWGTALPSSPSAQKQDHPRIARSASDPPLSRQGEHHKQFSSTVAQPSVAADPPAGELSAHDDCFNPLVSSPQDPPSFGPVIIRIESHSSQDPPTNNPQTERMTTREAVSAKQEEQFILTNGQQPRKDNLCRSSHVGATEKHPSLSQSSKVLPSSDRRATRKANSPKKTKKKGQENNTANGISIDSPRSRSTRESIIEAMISDGTSALQHAESPRKTKSKASSASFSPTRPINVNDKTSAKVGTNRCHRNAKESQAPERAIRNDTQCKSTAKTPGRDAVEESVNKLFAILEDSAPSMSVSSNSGPIMPSADDRANRDTLGGKKSTPKKTEKYKRSSSTMILEVAHDGARAKRQGDKTETEMDSASESTITLFSPEVLALIKRARANDSERRDSDSILTFDLLDDEASRGVIPERPLQEEKTTLNEASSMESSSDVSTIFSPKVLAAILKAKGLRVLDVQDSRSTLTFDLPDDLTQKKEPATIKLDRDETEASRLEESSHSSTSSPPGPNVLAIVQKARMLAADCSRQDTRSTLTFTLPQEMEEIPESEGANHHQPPRKSPSKKGKKKIPKNTASRKRASRNKSDVASPLNMTIVTCGSDMDNDSNSTLTFAFPKNIHPSRETKESIKNATETILLPTGEIRTSCMDQRRQKPSISERNPRIERHADKGNGKESDLDGRHESDDGFFNMLRSGGRILAASLARQRVDANLSDVDTMGDGEWSVGAEASHDERYDIDGAAQEWMNRHPDESFSKIDSKTVPCSGAVLLVRHTIQPDGTTPSPASETKTESPSRTRITRLQKILGAKSRLARKARNSHNNDNSTQKPKALVQLPGFLKMPKAVTAKPPQQGPDIHAKLVKTPSESPRSVRLRLARRRLGMVHEANNVGDSATAAAAAAANLKSRIASIEKCLDHSPEPRVKDEKRKKSPTAKIPVPTATKGEDQFDETDKANIVGDSGTAAAAAANVKTRIAAIEKCLDHSPEPRARDENIVKKSPPAKIPVTTGEDKFDETDHAGSAEPAIKETTETAAADNQSNGSGGGTDSGIEE